MRLHLVTMSRDRLDHERIWGTIGLIVGLAALILPLETIQIRCAFKALTGWPCPTCGMTRSFIRLRQFDFAGAFAANPLITAFVLFAGLYVVYAWGVILFRARRVRAVFTRRWEPTLFRALAVVALLGNWIYLIAVGR